MCPVVGGIELGGEEASASTISISRSAVAGVIATEASAEDKPVVADGSVVQAGDRIVGCCLVLTLGLGASVQGSSGERGLLVASNPAKEEGEDAVAEAAVVVTLVVIAVVERRLVNLATAFSL